MNFLKGIIGNKGEVKIDRSLDGSHGSHWDATVLDMNELEHVMTESAHPRYLTKLTKAEFAGIGEKVVLVAKYELKDPLYAYILRVETKEKHYELATGYPVIETAISYPCKISTVYEWPIKIEAQTEGNVKDPPLSFFATDYFLKKKDYLANKTHSLKLSGIAYAIERLKLEKNTLKDKDGKELNISRMKMIFPLNSFDREHHWMIDDYTIRGEIKSMKKIQSKLVSGYILKLDINPLEEVEIFASEKSIKGDLKTGDMVSAWIWLQGKLAEEEWNVLGEKDEK